MTMTKIAIFIVCLFLAGCSPNAGKVIGKKYIPEYNGSISVPVGDVDISMPLVFPEQYVLEFDSGVRNVSSEEWNSVSVGDYFGVESQK